MKIRNLVSVFLLLIALNCFSQDNLYMALTIPQELKEHANSVVRLDETIIEMESIKNLEHSYKRVITVLNENGNEDVNAVLYYDNGINVKKLTAIVYNSMGKEIKKFKKSDFEDVSAVSDFSLYDDSRVKYINYTPTEYPYTVEFNFSTSTENTAYVPTWRPLEGYFISTENSSYQVIYNPNMTINVKENNFSNYDIKDKSKDGEIKYSANNIGAIKYEAMCPSFRDFGPRLLVSPEQYYYEGYFGTAKDWSSNGKWMYRDLLQNRNVLPEVTKQEVRKLVSGLDDPIEKAKLIYKFVQDNTRYISVQEGVGGMQPMSALDVDRVKYGDCKGLSNYTKALLDVVGVESNYTRLYASRNNLVNVDKDFVSFLGQTNHVILNIPNGDKNIWLECTSQKVPFGHIANFADDRDVIVITPEGGRIEHTKAYSSKENYLRANASIILNESGGFKATYEAKSGGTRYDVKLNVLENDAKDKDVHYKEYWDYLNNIVLEKIELKNNYKEVEVSEKVEISIPSYAVLAGDKMLVKPNVFKRSSYLPPRYSERKLPFVVQRGYYNEDHFEINVPKNFVIESLPDNKEIKTKFGVYKMSLLKVDNTKLIYKRSLEITKGNYSKDDYNLYRSFRRKIVKADKSSFVITRSN